jgi:hypothetical protein
VEEFMKSRFTAAASLAGILALALPVVAPAQVNAARFNTIVKNLQQIHANYAKNPPAAQKMMDGAANASYLYSAVSRMQPQLLKIRPGATRAQVASALASASTTVGGVAVNNNSTDLAYSSFLGFTQSETNTAKCGNNVVVGFNDSGSYIQTLLAGTGGVSFSGVAVSHDGGQTFKDLGPVPAGSNINNFLEGDPLIGCSNSQTFYYGQLFFTTDSSGNPLTALAISTSTDGGDTWSDPVASVTLDGYTHTIDKDWMSVDPSDPQKIYMSYTDFDGSYSNPACPNLYRTAAEVVISHDGGVTWGAPITVDNVCSEFGENGLQGSHVVVGSTGLAYVGYVTLNNFPTGPRQLEVVSLGKHGTPSTPVVVDAVVAGGDTFSLQGGFRDFLGIDFTIDKSKGANDGALYFVWDDGRDKSVPDVGSQSGSYAFDDVLLRASYDGGNSWGFAPTKVNSDMQSRIGYGHDHYQPGVAVDSTGKIAVCWYDRRNDAQDWTYQRYCGESTGGAFTNFVVNPINNVPTHGNDGVVNSVYAGDYDGLTSDFLRAPGFIGAFMSVSSQANPDVRAISFP